MLKHPATGLEFVVTLATFVAAFDAYDREDTLGVYFERFDPNDDCQLAMLFEKHYLGAFCVPKYTAEHKILIARFLERSLSDQRTEFAAELSPEVLSRAELYLPDSWKIKDPRRFFAVAYEVIYRAWHAEMDAKGTSLTHPSFFLPKPNHTAIPNPWSVKT